MKKILLILLLIIFLTPLIQANEISKEEEPEKWGALDEVVIEKYALEKGKEPKPFIELEGDLLLFVFSLFSGIAGFIIGYYSRVIFSKSK